MQVRVVTAARPILDWDLVKVHLRGVAGDEERALVEGYIAAATAWLDGPAGWLGRSLGEQTLELATCHLCDRRLPCGPVVSIESIPYLDRAGDEQVLPDTGYRLLADGSIYAERWPAVTETPESVRIRYVAGYPDRQETPEEGADPVAVSTVPEPIRQAILLLVGQWFDHREAVSVSAASAPMPFAVDSLLSPYRVWS